MNNFQITIVAGTNSAKSQDENAPEKLEEFGVRKHSRGTASAIDSIESLGAIWDQVIDKLTTLASNSKAAAASTPYELSEIEFNIGIEAGLSIGLVTKGDASVSIKFAKK